MALDVQIPNIPHTLSGEILETKYLTQVTENSSARTCLSVHYSVYKKWPHLVYHGISYCVSHLITGSDDQQGAKGCNCGRWIATLAVLPRHALRRTFSTVRPETWHSVPIFSCEIV